MIDVLFAVACNVLALAWVLATVKLRPWKGFTYTHEDFSLITQYTFLDNTRTWDLVLYTYLSPIYSFIFFVFFGFGEEALSEYIRFGRRLRCSLNFASFPWYVVGVTCCWKSNRYRGEKAAQQVPSMRVFDLGTKVSPVDASEISASCPTAPASIFGSHCSPQGRDGGIPFTVETTRVASSIV